MSAEVVHCVLMVRTHSHYREGVLSFPLRSLKASYCVVVQPEVGEVIFHLFAIQVYSLMICRRSSITVLGCGEGSLALDP